MERHSKHEGRENSILDGEGSVDDPLVIGFLFFVKLWHQQVISQFEVPFTDSDDIVILSLLVMVLEITEYR